MENATINTSGLNGVNGLPMDNGKFLENRYNNNCYTYAINQPLNPHTGRAYESYSYCQPAYLGGKDNGRDLWGLGRNYDLIPELVKKDLDIIGYDFIPTTFEEFMPDENCWKVAFCYGRGDYHWYRQNTDGTWSHKMGSGSIYTTDDSGKPIHNPAECNRGEYKTFVGFFMIKKRSEVKVA